MNRYQIAANLEIAGLAAKNEISGQPVKFTLGKAEQENIFGAYLFGKQTLRVDLDGQGEVTVSRTCSYGTDSEQRTYTLEEIAEAAKAGKSLKV